VEPGSSTHIPATIPVKGRYVQMDYERHARRYGVPFKENKHFPIITLFLMRAVTGIQLRRPENVRHRRSQQRARDVCD